MAAQIIQLTDEQQALIASMVDSGQFPNAQAVVNAGLRALMQDKEDADWKTFTLRRAIEGGEASGIAEGDVFADVLEHIRLRASGHLEIAAESPAVEG